MNAHDERISSFLDNALPDHERSAFEVELRSNSELQQQVAELQQLRQDVALLPRYKAKPDFAMRVVNAALAAKADKDAQITPATRPKSPSAKAVRRAVLGGLALAASVAIIVGTLPWLNNPVKPNGNEITNNNNVPVTTPPEAKPFAAVLAALPTEGEALVLRIKSPKSVAAGKLLREALAEQGIEQRSATDQKSGGTFVGNAYRAQIRSLNLPASEQVRPADALYLQISPEELELALSRLAESADKIKFIPENRLAIAAPVPTGAEPTAVGEEPPPTFADRDFVQELSTVIFRLPKSATEAPASAVPAPGATPAGKVRVLILIEAVE